MSKNPLESKIETYLKKQIKNIGGLCYKFKSTINGVPDQLVIFNKTMHLVEVKRPGEVPRANQVLIHSQINKQGVPVYTVDTENAVDAFIKDVLKAEPKESATSNQKSTVIQSKNLFKGME
ncbi:VRR-NUC domain-containing protein [Evansella clarkii]|uniref:VRR-NUC domain-containing protein n=1 Tax=Evansella clarkii TaxID=79879 RepID=UPI001116D3C3|nr:VRR-NUC domain-containing protein [Evansella clarkii]